MRNKHPFAGTGVAIVTPFLENGEIDATSLEKLVNHMAAGGVEYIVVLGTTGENPTLNKNERQRRMCKGSAVGIQCELRR